VTTDDHHGVTDVDTTGEEIDESSAAEPEATATVEPTDGTQVDETPAHHEEPPSRWGLKHLLVAIALAVFFVGSAGLASWA
jgi:hypothetical protein